MEFRLLKADEIEARVSMVKNNGCQILLYKDARCDMNILDETVGAMSWKREHCRDNANCVVSIWDEGKKQWVSKEDTGKESNTEAEKGLASDSFKRACVNWGIGRELYTAPFIWFSAGEVNLTESGKDRSGKPRYVTFDRFAVTAIEYDGRRIRSVTVANTKNGKKKIFSGEPQTRERISEKEAKALEELIKNSVFTVNKVLTNYQAEKLTDLTPEQYVDCINILKKHPKEEADGDKRKAD